MQHHSNHNLGSRIQAKGMELQAQSRANQHRYRKRASVKAKLLGILIMLLPFIAIMWWANS